MQHIKNLLPAKVVLVLAILCTLVILWASLARAVPQIQVAQGDKLGHAIAYATLTILWGWFGIRSVQLPRFTAVIGSVALSCCAFGLLMEGLQYGLTTYRMFDWYDALANTTGVGIGVLCLMKIQDFYR